MIENLQNAVRLIVLTKGVLNTTEECIEQLKKFMEPEQIAEVSMRMARAHADIKEIYVEVIEKLNQGE